MKVTVNNSQGLWRHFAKFCEEHGEEFDKPYLLTLEEFKPPRTTEQNAKMHILWRQVAQHVGRSEDEIKAIFKQEFGPRDEVAIKNGKWDIPKSTTQYSRKECAAMMDATFMKGSEWGVEFDG